MSNHKSRLAKLEAKQQPQAGTWKDFVTGEWQPDPVQWAVFLAKQRPSDIAAYAEQLIAQGVPATPEQIATNEQIKQVTR